jgi:bifunctional diaminopimelate decarboxylase / aspartate kinase
VRGRRTDPWWRVKREALIALLGERDCAYVYDTETVRARTEALLTMRSVGRVLYAIKANPHPAILRTIADAGLGFECVSRSEVEWVIDHMAGLSPDRLLFTPSFAPRSEYAWATQNGIPLTVDSLYVLRRWCELFAGRDILLRLDAGRGHGHHEKVRTVGPQAKFGVPPEEFAALPSAVAAADARVVGLHAHGGSGNFELEGWLEPARILAAQAQKFPAARILNLGGGLGVPDRAGATPVDLDAFDRALADFLQANPGFELWLEPGRFLVASAGVLLARVTQLKGKGRHRYVGVATGMNSLIRPALYGAWHDIVNLTRLDEPATQTCTVVGPICESGDVLGSGRHLPKCEEGDVLLIAEAGAYGHAMSSHYNLRAPAPELLVPT